MTPLPLPFLYYLMASSDPLMVDSPLNGNWVVYLMGAGLTFFLIRNLNRIEKLLAQHSVEIRAVQDEQLKQRILHSDEYVSGTVNRTAEALFTKFRDYNMMMPSSPRQTPNE